MQEPTSAPDAYLSLAYTELRRLARSYIQREGPGLTLQPTALVHEAFLRLTQNGDVRIADRSHFLAIAARAMKRVLVDHARARNAAKRNPPAVEFAPVVQFTMDGAFLALGDSRILALDDALDRLRELDPTQAEIVEMRFFAGMTSEEVAGHMGVSRRTISREWSTARTWLRRELRKAEL